MHDRDIIIRGKRHLSLWKGPNKPIWREETVTIQEQIQKIKDSIEKQQKELADLALAELEFPDLKMHINRWHTQRYTSAKAIPLADKCEIAHNCGCCNDSPIELWPYTEFNGLKIFAEGIPFHIGEKCWCYGEKPDWGFAEKLRAKGLREEIITQATEWFEKRPCTCGQETETDDND
jgi:hypothetical protein